jgi:tRNA (guanine37-N1)-methyltransferase
LREALQDKLTSNELDLLKSAYDVVGTIGIVEIDDVLRHKETLIGETLLQINSLLKTVLRKDGSHSGDFRTQKMKLLAGEDTRETVHKENNARISVNVETVYYSPRLSNERIRIAKQVQPDERILHMFSGCAPCECVIGKNAEPREQIGIELNPAGNEFGLKNIKLNKLKNVTLYNADAKLKTPELGTFDRITMNLPKSAYEFLDEAISASHDGTILHYYDFLHEDEFDVAKKRVVDACKKQNKSCEILGVYTCGAQGVRTYRICVDVKIYN